MQTRKLEIQTATASINQIRSAYRLDGSYRRMKIKRRIRAAALALLAALLTHPASAFAVSTFEYKFGIQEMVLAVTDVNTGRLLVYGHGAIPVPGTGSITNKSTLNNPDHERTDISFGATDVRYYSDAARTQLIGTGTYSFNGSWSDTEEVRDSAGRAAYSFGPGSGTLSLTGNPLGDSTIFGMSMPASFAANNSTWEGELGALFGSTPRDGYISFSDIFRGFYTTGIAEHSWFAAQVGNRLYHFDFHGYNGTCTSGACNQTQVPEPTSVALLSVGLAGLARRRKARALR